MNATGKASLLSIPVKISDSMIPLRTERSDSTMYRILIIEDDFSLAEAMKKQIES